MARGLLLFTAVPGSLAIAAARADANRAGTLQVNGASSSVGGADAIDGPVPAAFRPRLGSVFRVGRTTVTCTSADSSGNTATARFVITVKRVRR